jgi:hypothetical protein
MLDKVDFPLTNTQISNFFLEQDYTDYFRVQQVISAPGGRRSKPSADWCRLSQPMRQ